MKHPTARWLSRLAVLLVCVGSGAPVRAAQTPTTLAVLNFANRSPGDGWDWLEKGLADMLITDLSASTRLQVVSRERMQLLIEELELDRAGLNRPDSGQRVGRAARAQQALCGSFSVGNGRIQINVQIIDVASGKFVRADSVSGPQEDVLKLERDLAGTVLRHLNVPLTKSERRRLAALPQFSLPGAKAFFQGINLYEDGRILDALALVRHAARVEPGHPGPLFWSGRLYQLANELKHAHTCYADLLRRFPADTLAPDALFHTGRVCARLGRTQDAVAAFKRLASEFGDATFATMVVQKTSQFSKVSTAHWAWLEIGRVLERCGADAEAAEAYVRCAPKGFFTTYFSIGSFDDRGETIVDDPPGSVTSALLGNLMASHYARTGNALRPSRGTILFDAKNTLYTENYSTDKRFKDTILCSTWQRGDGKVPNGWRRGDIQQDPNRGWYMRAESSVWDTYLLAAPAGQAFESLEFSARGSPWFEFRSADGVTKYHRWAGPKTGFATSRHRVTLPPGTALVRMTASAYRSNLYGWDIRAILKPLGKVGSLSITSIPEDAPVKLDGRVIGRTPCVIPNVTVGEHTISAEITEKNTFSCVARFGRFRFPPTRVRVTQGATTEVALRTPQTEPLLPGWLPPRLVIPAERAYKVGFAFDADGGGRVVLARCQQHDIFVAVRTIDGPWRKPRRLPDTINTPGREEHPVVSFSPNGTIWLAYLSVGPVKYQIFVTRSRDGKDWETPRVVVSSKHRPDRILLRALRDDRAVIIWRLSKYRQGAQVGEALYATTVPRSGAALTATISGAKLQDYSTVGFLSASTGVWHVLAGRRVFSSRDEGKTWKASGTVTGGVPHYAHVLGLLEPTPGTYWVRMISRQGPTRYGLFESTDLVQTRRLLEFPERLKAFTLMKRGGHFWIIAAGGFTRTIKPGLPFLTGSGGKRP